LRQRLCFTLEAFDSSSVPGHVFREKLQCNFPLELQIFSTVHHAHTAAAKLLDYAIVRNDVVQHCRSIRLMQV
jgi:hypothetical protein